LITRFSISNFKSIEFASLEFAGINFLVGKNGTGKTNFVDAFSFLSELVTTPLQTVINKRGGAGSVFRRVQGGLNLGSSPLRSMPSSPSLKIAITLTFPAMVGKPNQEAYYAVELQVAFLPRHTLEHPIFVRREQAIVTDGDGKKHFFDRIDQEIRSNDPFLKSMPDTFLGKDALALPLLSSFSNFRLIGALLQSIQSFSIDPAKLREFQDPDAGTQLLADGSNAVSVLEQLRSSDREALDRVFELLGAITPGTISVTTSTAGRKRFLRFLQQWGKDKRFRFDAFNMSDGTLRAFGLLLASFQVNAPDFMIIEQPEDSLHPGATAVILDVLRGRSSSQQTIITTHSPEVLDHFDPNEDEVFVVALKDGITRLERVDSHLIEGVKRDLCTGGDLLRLRQLETLSDERHQNSDVFHFFQET